MRSSSALPGNDLDEVRWITLTASGGPFRTWSAENWQRRPAKQALTHPNWEMGAKISVDSATMMNKGLEFIEAHHLFPVGLDRLRIVVHPQSVIHSMVEYRDGSTLAQLGPSDMRVPIASCLAWPKRMDTPCAPLDLPQIGELSFEAPDETAFPATRLAREAVRGGGAAPAILNAANEIAVAAFLAGQIGFTNIALTVDQALDREIPACAAPRLTMCWRLTRQGAAVAPRDIGDLLSLEFASLLDVPDRVPAAAGTPGDGP